MNGGVYLAKKERLNEEAALNNNLGASVLKSNDEIRKQQKKPAIQKGNNEEIRRI